MKISAQQVKELRDKTGSGMMDCKAALQEAEGDLQKAIDNLRKKGIAKAEKKSNRAANEGVVLSYIHPGNKIGVLIEVNCETDFVANTEAFQTFVSDVAMHIAATNPVSIRREEIDKDLIAKESEIYREQAKLQGKPEKVLDKIVEGRLNKFFQEQCLEEQQFVKNTDLTIKEYLTETISKVGENIHISRFARYQIGEK